MTFKNRLKRWFDKFGRKRGFWKTALKFAGFCLIALFFFGLLLFIYFIKDLPDPSAMGQQEIVQSTKIYDRTGKTILYDIHGEEKRTVVTSEQIPQIVKDATVASEDDDFFHHLGLDWKGILRAAWLNVRGKKVSQGGSTITQQYIKNAYLGGPNAERTFSRKIKEAILSVILELKYSKDEILTFYLNQVPYGSNAYGIEAASQTFFGKPVAQLDLAQAALLAALIQSPSYYSPYGSHFDDLKYRQEYVLNNMIKLGYISQQQADDAKKEELKFASSNFRAQHFVTMVKEYLEEKYGPVYSDIDKAGLKVYTTLDWELQQIAEQAVEDGVERNKKYRAGNAALAALDPKTGQLLALIGSRSYDEDQFNVAISPYRQPGSSFKPFAYAAAFEKGYIPETILFDLPINFRGNGISDYEPNNYDMKFRGPITLKNSLAQSINVTSVQTLYLAGVSDTIELAQKMGITTLKNKNQYGLSLVLGGGEVKLLDETAAYGVFAANGIKHPVSLILKVEDGYGNVLEEYQDQPKQVLSEQTAKQINDILSDNTARTPVFGPNSKLHIPERPTAAKTGTTQNYSDGWTVGYTPSLAVGVWAGNNDFSKKMTQGADGVYVAAPIWNDFMQKAYAAKTSHDTPTSTSESQDNSLFEEVKLTDFVLPKETESFAEPEPSPVINKPLVGGDLAYKRIVAIDKISQKLATNLTPPELIEEKIFQEAHCILYYVDKNDPLGDFPQNPSDDPQFSAWENAVLNWSGNQPCQSGGVCYGQNPPGQYDDIHTKENQPTVNITSPNQGQTLDLTGSQIVSISVSAQANLGVKQVDFFVNDRLVNNDTSAPYSVSFNILPYLINSQTQTIKVRAYDSVLNRQEAEIEVRILN